MSGDILQLGLKIVLTSKVFLKSNLLLQM